ncbi:MAG: hypothetical protein JST22_06840 [Bacteroidetes bacterium]|nr:hypothetical protein [Bacteroidota bacterium]
MGQQYRHFRLANITLSSEREAAWNESNSTVSNPVFDAPWLLAVPDEYEERLRDLYHTSPNARDRWEILEDWLLHLHTVKTGLGMTEQELYAQRVEALIAVAQAAIDREMRRARFEADEDAIASRTSVPKLHINAWSDDLTRIFETCVDIGMISSTAEPSKIVAMFTTERVAKDLAANYRTSRDRINGRHPVTPSMTLTKLVKGLLDRLSAARIEEIMEHAEKVLAVRSRSPR